jgi:hypothetical protein
VFEPGSGDANGNGPAIRNDWHWRAELHLDSTRTIRAIRIWEEDSNQIWTTDNPDHWPLVVLYRGDQLNRGYRDVLGDFGAGRHQLDLYGQIDNRKMYGTRLQIDFTDSTAFSVAISKSQVQGTGSGS